MADKKTEEHLDEQPAEAPPEAPGAEAAEPEAEAQPADAEGAAGEGEIPDELQMPTETPSGEAPGDEGPGGGAPTYEELQAQVAELKDQLLRALAETENTRRRAQRDKSDASKYAIAGFAREILSVADNFQRALDAVPDEARGNDEAVDNLYLGVEMTGKELAAALEKVGITEINALGQPFDHNFHQAMFEIEDPDKPAGTVVQEMQKGYMIQDRLLRPAMVGVSKGGDKAPPPEEPKGEPEGEAAAKDSAADKANDASAAYEKPGEPAGSKLDTEL
jgi:molecular chaperone GrpE